MNEIDALAGDDFCERSECIIMLAALADANGLPLWLLLLLQLEPFGEAVGVAVVEAAAADIAEN